MDQTSTEAECVGGCRCRSSPARGLFSLAVYSRLPELIAVHWGMSGEPNRFGSRIEGAFLMPAMMIAIYLIMQWYPSRDPRATNIAKFRGSYDTVVTTTIAFLGAIHTIVLGSALGWRVDMTTTVLVGVGVMFIAARQPAAARALELHLRHPDAVDAVERRRMDAVAPRRRLRNGGGRSAHDRGRVPRHPSSASPSR